jgi:hypothetical protein
MKIIATRKDFIDQYVGWSYMKTTKFLEENINNEIFIDESEGLLYLNEHDRFGLEVIIALKKFGGHIEFLNKDRLQYYFTLPSVGNGQLDKLEDLFQK